MAIEGWTGPDVGVVKELLHAFDAGWAARDPEALADLFTEDAVWEDPTFKRAIRGKRELRDYFAAMLRAFPDIEVHQEQVLLDPDDDSKGGSRWVIRGTFRENLESPDHLSFPIAATGDRVEFTGVALASLRDGKIERLHECIDYMSLQRQIGALPPVGSRGEHFLARLQAFGARRRFKKNARG